MRRGPGQAPARGRSAGIVVAAGAGERLAAGMPKALVPLAGEPLVVHAARAMVAAARIDDVVVVAAGDDLDRVAEALERARVPVARLCPGGASRRASVAAGLLACPRGTGVVAVHDAARALVEPALVDRTVTALDGGWAAVAPGLPVVDTLKLMDETRERVLRTVPRTGMWAVQTPQVFTAATLQRVHARLANDEATDDLGLVEAGGGRVRVIPGSPRNFKITFPDDLALAEALLRAER